MLWMRSIAFSMLFAVFAAATSQIEDEYIVTMEADQPRVTDLSDSLETQGIELKSVVRLGSKTFMTVKGKAENVAQLSLNPGVLRVEPNYVVTAFQDVGKDQAANEVFKKHPATEIPQTEDEYIVVMEADQPRVTDLSDSLESQGIELKSVVHLGSKSFLTVKGKAENVARLSLNPGVLRVEPNYVVTPLRVVEHHAANETSNDTSPYVCLTQDVRSPADMWGLDRIDQHARLPLSGRYTYGELDQGTDVIVYVVDSGIRTSHRDFDGRAIWGYTAPGMDGDADLNGHGTHVAGIVGATTYGVAKNATLVAVKVLDEDGTGGVEGIIYAFNWIEQDFVSRGRPKSVINLSLGISGISETLDEAVNEMIDLGLPAVIAAGNDARDACSVSPANVPRGITVGASDVDDNVAYFSNWGRCVDLFAPGHEIRAPWIFPDDDRTISGTSQAAPHVAGVIARYLSTLISRPTPAAISSWVVGVSTKGVVTFINQNQRTSPDRLLYMECFEGEWTTIPDVGGASHLAEASWPLVLGIGLWCLISGNVE